MKSLHQRRWCLLLCLCVVGLALAACSGGGDANHDNGRSESDDDDDDHPLDGAVIESIEPDEFENLLPTIVTITANKLPETVDEIRFADTLLENFTRLSATVVVVTVPSGFIPDVYDVQVEGNQGRVVALEGVTVRDALTPFAWLTGVVRDRDGEPIEGLDVFSTAGSDSSRTGSSGLFDLLVRQGPAELHALNSDWDGVPGIPIGETTLLAETYFTDDEQFDFTLRYHYLSGHIAGDDGDDLAAAGVQIFHVAEYGVVGAATTDFSGEFDIPLYPGDYTLLAQPPEETTLAPYYLPQFRFDADDVFSAHLDEGLMLFGQITDRNGEGLHELAVTPHFVADKHVAMGSVYTDIAGE